MTPASAERLPLASRRGRSSSSRQAVRRHAVELGFSLVDQTKMVTAASELARNSFSTAAAGTLTIEIVGDGARQGLRLTFEDRGPGIADIELAHARRVLDRRRAGPRACRARSGSSNEFAIESTVGKGTRVVITRWK